MLCITFSAAMRRSGLSAEMSDDAMTVAESQFFFRRLRVLFRRLPMSFARVALTMFRNLSSEKSPSLLQEQQQTGIHKNRRGHANKGGRVWRVSRHRPFGI